MSLTLRTGSVLWFEPDLGLPTSHRAWRRSWALFVLNAGGTVALGRQCWSEICSSYLGLFPAVRLSLICHLGGNRKEVSW